MNGFEIGEISFEVPTKEDTQEIVSLFEDKGIQLETPTEEVAKEEDKKEEVITEPTPAPVSNKYKDYYETMVGLGEWQPLSDESLEDISWDEDDFKSLIEAQNKEKLESATSVFSEQEKEFLDFKKNGGDLEQYAKSILLQKQIDNLDMDSPKTHADIVYAYYRNVLKLSDEKISKKISLFTKEELEQGAVEGKEELEKLAQEQHNSLVEKTREEADKKAQEEKKYEKEVTTQLTSESIKPTEAKKIVDFIMKKDAHGLSKLDMAYIDRKNDPKFVKKLHDFLVDYDSFVKNASKNDVVKTKLSTMIDLKVKKRKAENIEVEETNEKQALTFTLKEK